MELEISSNLRLTVDEGLAWLIGVVVSWYVCLLQCRSNYSVR